MFIPIYLFICVCVSMCPSPPTSPRTKAVGMESFRVGGEDKVAGSRKKVRSHQGKLAKAGNTSD